jgi:hypothetical protein
LADRERRPWPWSSTGLRTTLVVLAWEALLSVTARLTRHAGTDVDAAQLIPSALRAARRAADRR